MEATIKTNSEKYKIGESIIDGFTKSGNYPASLFPAKKWNGLNWENGFLIMMDDDFVYGFHKDENVAFDAFCEYAN